MKAARFSQFGGPEVLAIVELPDPHAGAGQIRIAVRAAGVNAGLEEAPGPDGYRTAADPRLRGSGRR